MKKRFIFLGGLMLTSFLTGCQTYFGYNEQRQVTTQVDFQNEYSNAKQMWKTYVECYSKPIKEEIRDKLRQEAESLYKEIYGSYYNSRHTHEQYEEKIHDFAEQAAHRYRMIRGVNAKIIPSLFLTLYPSYQSFQTAKQIWEQKYLAIESEFERTNLPDAVQISSVVQNYVYKDGFIYGNYLVKSEEPQIEIATRSHIYSDNATWVPPFVFLRYPFDFIACFCGDWELAEHKPDIFTLISYCPPFSWFFTRTPPYFTEPAPGRTEYQVIISEQGSTVVEREKTQEVPQTEILHWWFPLRRKILEPSY